MAGNLHPIRTKEILGSGFESPVPPIAGELNLRELIRVWKYYKKCAQQTETNYNDQNFLYTVLSDKLWPYFSTRPKPNPPIDPGQNSSYNDNESQTYNTTVRDVWQLNNKNYEENKHLNRALVDRFLNLIRGAYKSFFNNQQQTNNPK